MMKPTFANAEKTAIRVVTKDSGNVIITKAAQPEEFAQLLEGGVEAWDGAGAARRAEILAKLQEIDLKSIRPLRAGDADILEQLEAQAVALRAELAGL